MTRAAFFGTPAIAVPALNATAAACELVGVVCQPDRPAGRGLKTSPPAVKAAAQQLGVDVYQPQKVKRGNLDAWLRERSVEIVVVMAYGRILPPNVLQAPRLGCVNLHASLLPKYRGAAPINWALINGEQETGISLMRMEEGLDTGPIYCQHHWPISEQMNAGELAEALADLAAECIARDLPRLLAGDLTAMAQDHAQASHARPLTAQDGVIHWSEGARDIHNRVRGLAPRPGAFSQLEGQRLKLLETATAGVGGESASARPGYIVQANRDGIRVQTGSGQLEIRRAQLAGRKPLDARDLVNGRVLRAGQRLGEASGSSD